MPIDVYFYAAARDFRMLELDLRAGSAKPAAAELRRFVTDRYPSLALLPRAYAAGGERSISSTPRTPYPTEIGSTFFPRLRAVLRSFFAKSATERFHSTRFGRRSSIPGPEGSVSSTASSATTRTASRSRGSTTKHTRAWPRREMTRVLEGVIAEHAGRSNCRGPSSRPARRRGCSRSVSRQRTASGRHVHGLPQSDRSIGGTVPLWKNGTEWVRLTR